MTRRSRALLCGATHTFVNFSLFIAAFYNLQRLKISLKGDTDLNEKMKSEMRRKVREMMDR
jgi:hypothetical protein